MNPIQKSINENIKKLENDFDYHQIKDVLKIINSYIDSGLAIKEDVINIDFFAFDNYLKVITCNNIGIEVTSTLHKFLESKELLFIYNITFFIDLDCTINTYNHKENINDIQYKLETFYKGTK